MRKLVISVLAGYVAAGVAQADGLSQSFTVTQNLTSTDWVGQLAIPKFNVSGAVLDSAVLTYGGSVVYTDTIFNTTAVDGSASLSSAAILDFGYNSDAYHGKVSLGNELISNNLSYSQVQTLTVPASSSASTGSVTAQLGPANYTVTDLTQLTGSGFYNLDIGASGKGNIDNTSLFGYGFSASTSASAYVTVTYNYHVPEAQAAVPVPWGPAAAQLLLAGGLLALARRFGVK